MAFAVIVYSESADKQETAVVRIVDELATRFTREGWSACCVSVARDLARVSGVSCIVLFLPTNDGLVTEITSLIEEGVGRTRLVVCRTGKATKIPDKISPDLTIRLGGGEVEEGVDDNQIEGDDTGHLVVASAFQEILDLFAGKEGVSMAG